MNTNNKLIRHTHILLHNCVYDEFDAATVGSVILGIGDIIWLSKDILHNGFGTTYGIIAFIFLLGNVLLVVGLRQHHERANTIKNKKKESKKVNLKHVHNEANWLN
mgnify:CR=1 FL=1